MNRTNMNWRARMMIAVIAAEKGIESCEIKLPGCLKDFALAPAHRKKRIDYRSVEELADFNEWVAACQHCHNHIEESRSLTEEIFKKLRP